MDKHKARLGFVNHLTKRWFWGKRVYNVYKADEVVELAKRASITLTHARTFITSRQKMHKDGIKLYDEQLAELEQIVTEGEDEKST